MCKDQFLIEDHVIPESTGGELSGFDIDGALHADSSRAVAVQAKGQLLHFLSCLTPSVSTSEAGKSLCLYGGYLASAGDMLPKQLALPALLLCLILHYLVSS